MRVFNFSLSFLVQLGALLALTMFWVLLKEPRRRGWIAALLTFVGPGLGHAYNGRPKGAGLALAIICFVDVLISALFISNFSWLLVGAAIGLCAQAVVAYDAYRTARNVHIQPIRWY